METLQKIIFHPVALGTLLGLIAGSTSGLIVANEYDRATKKDLLAGACIGGVVGSCNGALFGLINKNNRK